MRKRDSTNWETIKAFLRPTFENKRTLERFFKTLRGCNEARKKAGNIPAKNPTNVAKATQKSITGRLNDKSQCSICVNLSPRNAGSRAISKTKATARENRETIIASLIN